MSRRKTDAQGDAAAGAETRLPQGETEPGQAGALPAGENAMDRGDPGAVEHEGAGQPPATEGGAGEASLDEAGAPVADAGPAAPGETIAGDGGDGTTLAKDGSALSGAASEHGGSTGDHGQHDTTSDAATNDGAFGAAGDQNAINGGSVLLENQGAAEYGEVPAPLTPAEEAYRQRINAYYEILEGPAFGDDAPLYTALFQCYSMNGVLAHMTKSLVCDLALLSVAECIEAAALIRRIGHARATSAVIGQHLKLAALRKNPEFDGTERVQMEIFAFTLATLDGFAQAERDRRAAAEAKQAERKPVPIEETIFEPTDDLDARTY